MPPATGAAPARPASAHPGASIKLVSPQQRSDNHYREAVAALQRGRMVDAEQSLRLALADNAANHNARQLLAGLLVDARRNAEASALLRDGLALAPGNSDFSMALARLQVAAGARGEALATLERGLAGAGDDPEYHAFLAALLANLLRGTAPRGTVRSDSPVSLSRISVSLTATAA